MAKGNKGGGSSRGVTVRVRTAKKRTTSSQRWLQRQLNDPYVRKAKQEGYRSRAAYKLIELDEKFHFLKPGQKIVDLGAAPGGWTQVAAQRIQDKGKVVGTDLLPITPLPPAILLQMDFMDDAAPDILKEALEGEADVVLSDMAPNTTGHTPTDHIRIMTLCELAYAFAVEVLKKDGVFIAKVWQGGTEQNLLAEMKKRFQTVKHAKPKASRQDSAETYVVAIGFKG